MLLPATSLLVKTWVYASLLLLSACAQKEPLTHQQAYVFGTMVEVSIYGVDRDKANAAISNVLALFDRLHHSLHAWQPSDLQQLNTALATPGRRTKVSDELAYIIQDAGQYSNQTDGLFNPAIGHLIRLWGFQSDTPTAIVPADAEIDHEILLNPSMKDIHVKNREVWSDNGAVQLDLGGYAKGYALDRAAALLKKQGIRNALINIGGNIMALGTHGERAWEVGVQHPREPGVIATLALHDGEAIGTSGDYQRYFEVGGKRYCHLIDPRTGRPADSMESVTIVVDGPNAGVRSDVLTKPLFIDGRSTLPKWTSQLALPMVLGIDHSGQVWISRELLARIKWAAPQQTFHTF